MAIKRLKAKGTRGDSLSFHAKPPRIARFPYLEGVSPRVPLMRTLKITYIHGWHSSGWGSRETLGGNSRKLKGGKLRMPGPWTLEAKIPIYPLIPPLLWGVTAEGWGGNWSSDGDKLWPGTHTLAYCPGRFFWFYCPNPESHWWRMVSGVTEQSNKPYFAFYIIELNMLYLLDRSKS